MKYLKCDCCGTIHFGVKSSWALEQVKQFEQWKSAVNSDYDFSMRNFMSCRECGEHYTLFEEVTDAVQLDAKMTPIIAEEDIRIDMDGQPSTWNEGDRVMVCGQLGTVQKQNMCYDGYDYFWGNVFIEYDDGLTGWANSWQCKKV